MHAREIIVILFVILLILFGLRTYGHVGVPTPTHAIEPLTVYPTHTSNDSLGIDPVTQRNTYANKYVPPSVIENIKPARTRKNVSFAPQKEVARYSKQDGEIKDIAVVRT
jgi:hypothetical protein